VVPVEGGGGIVGELVRVEQGPGHAGCLGGPHHQHGLVVVAPPFDREHAITGDRARDRRTDAQERAEAGVKVRPARKVPDDEIGAKVLLLDPGRGGRVVAPLEPAIRVCDLDSVQNLYRVVTAGRRRRRNVRPYDLRPAFGLLPWLAFLRRALVLRLEVFFDIGEQGYSAPSSGPKQGRQEVGCEAAHAMRSSAAQVFTIWSTSISWRAAFSHP
jgi:hypothetical protein